MDTLHQDHAYCHRPGEAPLIGVTIDEHFRRVCGRFPDRDAVVCLPQQERVSYARLDELVDETARALLKLGVARGDRVGVWSTDNLQWILLQMATARVGAILVNINPAYRLSELRHALRLAQVQYIFLIPEFRSSKYIDMMLELCPEARKPAPTGLECQLLPHLHAIVTWDPMNLDRTETWADGVLTWRAFLENGRDVPAAATAERAASLDPDDPVNIQFTSGTTGFPKAVVLTHHNILNNSAFTARAMKFTEKDRLCVPLPFYHCFGMVVSNLVCLSVGAAIVIPSDHFEAGATLQAIEEERCTAVHGVPTMFLAELDHPDFPKRDMSSLRTGIMAGAPCPPELMRRVMEDMGCREILIGYGQTEAAPLTHLTQPDDSVERRTRTVGRSMPHQECKIVDPETGRTLDRGQAGEVCVRGHNVMRGYYAQPEATAKTIDDAHWLHTGDLGVMDEDGYLAITGRLKDMIIRGGENIYPAEIEATFYENGAVEEIAVFGVPHEKYGEEVGAWVRMQPGAERNEETLREWGRAQIAHFKIPTRVWFVDEFPMTVTGKIQKNRIRDAVQRWMDAGEPNESIESFIR